MSFFTPLITSPIQLQPAGSDSLVSLARITETSDASGSTSTRYSMSLGDTFSGNLSYAGDRDWVAIQLTAGQTYSIGLSGYQGGGGTLSDPYLRLYDSSGQLVTYNDDTGSSLDSSINITIANSGTYYVAAGSWDDRYSGTYEITTALGVPTPTGTLDELANYLTDGYWTDTARYRRSFDTSVDNTITVNLTGLTADGQQLVRWALEAWAAVADINFQETSSGSADIRFQDHDAGAYSSSHNSGGGFLTGGTISYSIVNVSTSWLNTYGTSIESYSMSTYIHEIGHALGLGHQGNYNGGANFGSDNTFLNDSWQMSIMSYFNQTENTSINASLAALLTPMMADIVAIQNLYGAASGSSETAGDTVWGANSNLGGALGQLFDSFTSSSSTYEGGDIAFTIYDQGGNDTLNLTNFSTNNRIDMRGDSFSDVAGLIGNVGVARGTVLENLYAGSGNDTITGNSSDNLIDAGAGNDILRGENGADSLYAHDGADTINGGDGDDFIFGGATAADLRDVIYAGEGNDVIDGGYGNDLIYGQNGNDQIAGGFGADELQGQDGDDVITGSALSDLVYGGAGNDFVNGGFGHDRINGGSGADRFYHLGISDHGSDWVQDYTASEGDVLFFGNSSASVDDFQVNLTNAGSGDSSVAEAFVIYRPTGQIIWALVDGAGQDEINLRIGGEVFDLMA